MQELAREILTLMDTCQEVCVHEGRSPFSPFEEGDAYYGSVHVTIRRMRRPRHDKGKFILEQTQCQRRYHGPVWDDKETCEPWVTIATFDDALTCVKCFMGNVRKFGYRIEVEGQDLCLTEDAASTCQILEHIV